MKQCIENMNLFFKVEYKQSDQTITPILTQNPPNIRKFHKITNSLKRSLIKLVTERNCSIKKAGQILNLSYSTAKTSQKKFKGDTTISKIQCSFKAINKPQNFTNFTLYTSIGSRMASQKSLIFFVKQQQNQDSQFIPEAVYVRAK